MKKVMLLVLTVMLISSFLMASGPSLKVVRLVVINKSGNEVMIKLEGSELGNQFYYLTVAAGTKTWPEVQVFTILEDIYKRSTWYGEGKYAQCVGTSSSGQLVADRNIRLTFTPCFTVPLRTIGFNADGTPIKVTNNGEPSMEKVVYYKYLRLDADPEFDWEGDWFQRSNIYWKRGCGANWWLWMESTQRVPTRGLCQWRYLYDSVHED